MQEQLSDVMKEAQTLGEMLNDLSEIKAEPKALPFRWVREHLVKMFGPAVVSRDADDKLRAVMLVGGNRWTSGKAERVTIGNVREQFVLLNKAMQNAIEQLPQTGNDTDRSIARNELIRKNLVHPNDEAF